MITTAVSLFAGVGGFDLALQRSGIDVVASVEIDSKARAVLAKQFPNTQLFEDVCQVSGKDFINAGFTPNEGIMVGGFPCQDLSVAGKRSGLAGNRSGLFFEFIRLIDETKTKFVILENVPGLLSSNKGRDMGTVIGSLDDLGYSVAWRVLDAQFFGVPQRRRRVFIVGSLGDDWRTPFEILALSQGRAGHFAKSQQKRKTTSTDSSVGAGNFELFDFPVESISPALTRSRAHDTMTFRQRGFGDYANDSNASALKARDYKDATDLVVHEN
jgi:DNA (cytosine-5)-methyltransferase 1